MRLLIAALLLLPVMAPSAAAGDVTLKFAEGLRVEEFIAQAALSSGGVFLYVAEDVKDKALGGPYSLKVPAEKFPEVVRFLLGLNGISVRHFEGRWPVTVVLPRTATATKYRIAGTNTTLDFNRPPSAWRLARDAEGAMTAESADALMAEVTAPAGAGRRAAAVLLGLAGPRDKQAVEALTTALGATDGALRLAAAEALGRCGYAARSALPALKNIEDEVAKKAVAAIEGAVSPALLNPRLAKEKAPDVFRVKFETTKGDILIEVVRAWSPRGADRFFNLVKIGYFHDIAFFRMANFVVQFGIHGDARVNGAWRNANIGDDPVRQSNKKGTLAFANSGRNSRTVQLFINILKNNAGRRNLDAMGFSPFARIVEGMDVVAKLNKEYGERPNQQRIQFEGNAYLRESFPNLDYIKRAKFVE